MSKDNNIRFIRTHIYTLPKDKKLKTITPRTKILLLACSLLTTITFTFSASAGLLNLININDSADDDVIVLTDFTTLSCYQTVVEQGQPLPQYCAQAGWTVSILESGSPIKFGNTLIAVAFEKPRLILGPCQVDPSICTAGL